ncbi:spore coat protein CotH [Paenibacillus sp. LMG 31456]|uniref:Spore coat protein CotH n=1 Tax=Paenibacillus foliorum TaxID=2654974 RepID=A0A972GSI8_9BACL|nr:CotH kinase family protein [Paenibacillus foliorum]NOU96064.1 spore coat protein CotH [Paenibacillus foliorum]
MEWVTRNIIISPKQFELLQKNVWSPNYVQAYMVIQGKRELIKLRYRGGHTREYPKKSYEIVLKGKTYHYNAEYDDPSMIRNALSFQFFQWIGVPSPKTRHCLLKINGYNMGVYLEIEAVDKAFFRKRGIAVQSLFYAVNDNATFGLYNSDSQDKKTSLFQGYERVIGKQTDVKQLKAFILKINTLKGKQLSLYLDQRLDIDNYLRWLAGAVFTGNYDGFDQNYAVYLHKTRFKYRMIPWDYEGTWGRNCYGKQIGSDLVKVTGYNELTRSLLAFPLIRKKYKNLLNHILKQHFTVKKIAPVVKLMISRISPHIHVDSTRKWALSVFDGEPDLIRSYIIERREIIKEALKKL